MKIQIISSLAYVEVKNITSYNLIPERNGLSKVFLKVLFWKDIPMHLASGEMQIISKQHPAGTYYTCNISARLKVIFGTIPESLIKITLCDGRELILGTPFIPVKSDETRSLTNYLFSIQHNGIDPPLEMITSI
ncbi:hypothetical protein GCM10022216_14380 [Sphingobacterium kyonggiense]|uniref:Uncharacterized protein n=1 Tax=Sphingobacterium kyonggiense TaxID=714075 RepID=A0ABP7YMB9_9SPHI